MQVSFKIAENLIWVFLAFPTFFYPSLSAPTSSELVQFCGPLNLPANSTLSFSFITNFINVMDSVLKEIAQHKWGQFSVITPLPEIHALAQCRNDLSIVDCIVCFSQARVKLPLCLPATAARIHLEGCFLRYDSYNFFRESVDPQYDSVSCTDPTDALKDTSLHMEFNDKVSQVIENVTELALKNRTFATLEASVGVIPVYALAQCWNTLSEQECRNCLMMAGSKLRLCAPHSEGRALFTGCHMKYSTERFFDSGSEEKTNEKRSTGIIIAIVLSSVAFVVLAVFGAFIGHQRLSKMKEGHKCLSRFPAGSNLNFEYEVLEQATDFFSDTRKLGQGGAGSVFKGTLPNGRTVAVKRLEYNTRQWVDQFFNEVNLISGIQHPNLVRLLGCSIEGPESLLVYEYVPNRSLDQMLFVNNTKHILSWEQRFNIILGTAEGLAYLHGGCGAKIIHRDIKTSNILLDEKFSPKIADFGLARCAASDDSHISTGIAGTLGYMAPEYLIRGQLTEKTDVYGFGVLAVEIVSGKKNSVFSQGSSSILHSVWKNHKANTITETIFPGLMGEFPEKLAADVLRIGLLCTQASAASRPSMAEVVEMLTNQKCEIPAPKQPPFLNASVLSLDDSTESCITRVPLTKSSDMNQGVIAQPPTSETQISHTPVSGASSPFGITGQAEPR